MSEKTASVNWTPKITDAAFPYLAIQQGRISELAGDRAAWEAAYRRGLVRLVEELVPFLPMSCSRILDIGAGMGGIDAALNAYYGFGVDVTILDGYDDAPRVQKKDQTYSNAEIAKEFLRWNGVQRVSALIHSPGDPIADDAVEGIQCDLVLGIQSWGFHFDPKLYLDVALAMSRPGTRWILDMRRTVPNYWLADLCAHDRLRPIGEAEGITDKYLHHAFEVIS